MPENPEPPEWLIKQAVQWSLTHTLTIYPITTFFGPAGVSMTREEIEGLAYEDGASEGYIAGYLAATPPTYEDLRRIAVLFNTFMLKDYADHALLPEPFTSEDRWMLSIPDCRTIEEKAHDLTIT